MADLSSNISTNAQGPRRVVQDGVDVQQHSLRDQIEADRYLRERTATAGSKSRLPIRLAKIKPGGAT